MTAGLIKLHRLAYWMNDIVAPITKIDGHLFIDRFGRGEQGLRDEISKYSSTKEAQSYINIVLLENFISEVIGEEWTSDELGMVEFLAVYERAWTFQIKASHPSVAFVIEKVVDDENGDLGLRLLQN